MSVPIGFLPDPDSGVLLPAAMQLIGPLWGEEKVLRVGLAFERAWDWRVEEWRV